MIGNYMLNQAPLVGEKTVTAVAAQLFAGASAMSGRQVLIVRNNDPAIRIRVGPSGVTQQSGTPVEPGASAEFPFDQAASVPVFAISEGAAVAVNIWEGK